MRKSFQSRDFRCGSLYLQGCKQKVIEGPRDPTLPTTVPMPSAIEDITDAGMRAMWEQSMAMDGEAAPCVEPLD